jgi:hypothetical protein
MAVSCPNCGKDLEEVSLTCPDCRSLAEAAIPATEPPAPPLFSAFEANESPRGIGGWLILVGLGLVLGPIFQLFAIWTNLRAFTGPNRAVAERVIPGISALVLFQLLTGCVLLLANLFLLVLFFREKRSFPRYIQVWLGFSAAVSLAAYTLCPHDATMGVAYEATSKLVQNTRTQLAGASWVSLLRAGIWIAYFGVSRRVRATFVQ